MSIPVSCLTLRGESWPDGEDELFPMGLKLVNLRIF